MSDEVVTELGRAARGGAIALVGMVISAIFGFLVRAIIGRVYGPAEYGTYSLAFTVFSIAMIFVKLGFPMGLQRQVSYYLTKMPERVHELISTAIVTVTISSIVGALTLLAVRDYLPNIIGGNGILPSLLFVFGLAVVPSGIFAILISVTQGFKRVREYIIYTRLLVPLLYFLLVAVVAWVLRLKIEYVAVSYLAVQVIGLVLITEDLLQANILPRRISFSPSLAKTLVLFSAPLMLSNIVWFIMTWTDTLMLGHYLGSTIVGIYNAATPLARFIPVFLSAFTVIYSPMVTSMYAKGKLADVNRFYKAITKWIVLLTFPLFLLLVTMPSWILAVLFGKEYTPASTSLSILAVGYMIHTIVGPNGLTLVSIGKPNQEMIGNMIGATLNITINLLLIPKYGLEGAATATAISYTVANIYKSVLLWLYGIKPFTKRYLKIIHLGLITTICLSFIPPDLRVFAFVVALSFFYFFFVLTGGLEQIDVEILEMALQKLGIRENKITTFLSRYVQ